MYVVNPGPFPGLRARSANEPGTEAAIVALSMTDQATGFDPFDGRRDRLGPLDDFPCKAHWQAARHRYVLDEYGERGVSDVLSRLTPALREAFLRPAVTMAWSTVATVVGIDRAIYEGPMGSSLNRMRHFGSEIAKYDVPGIYRAFFRLGTPGFILGKIPLVYRQYFKKGAVKCHVEQARAEIHLEGVAFPHYLCAYGITGWFDAMLELVGTRGSSLEHTACVHRDDPGCTWTATWRR